MRVKRLEVQGFKSFKDKTIIHFDHNITGIVGPNGCGKSNIVDAFFWVMGEQSHKHIRAGGSADLIFNGSSKYQPLAIAEATLVLETDVVDTENAPSGATVKDVPLHLRAKEISVTRRVYRTGEGEYLINGVPARLKDIHELFLDTGVGAKGYSIIAQGEIQKIVNAKPEDRRMLIEEAAGIAKYKKRKIESLRKLESAQANLARLNDVIAEIERSVNSLERQAHKAAQYKTLKAELLDKEMTWGRRKNRVLREKLELARTSRETLEQEIAGLKAELSSAELSIESDRIEQLTLSKQAEEFQNAINEMSGDLTRAQSALDLSKRRQLDLQTQLETLEAERTDLRAAISNEKSKISGLEAESANAGSEHEAAAARASDKDEAVRSLRAETDTARKTVDQAKRDLMASIARDSDLNSRVAGLASKADSAHAQVERLSTQIETLRVKVVDAENEASNAQSAYTIAASKKSSLQSECQAVSADSEAKEQETKAAQRSLEESATALLKLRSRLASLEELNAAFEGFGDGPRSVLDWAKNNGKDGSLKALADGLDIQAGFEKSVEGWLEGRLENLASDDSAIALQALRELSSGNQGRATIYVAHSSTVSLDATDASVAKSKLASSGFSVSGLLSEFVHINDKIGSSGRSAAQSVLSNAIVVENFDALPSLIQNGGIASLGGFSIVSKMGEVFSIDGSIRGGATQSDNSASVLGRKRAIAELTEQVSIQESAYASQEAQVQGLISQLEMIRANLSALKIDLQASEITAATCERDVQTTTRQLSESKSTLELEEYEHAEMKQEEESALQERSDLLAQMESLKSAQIELEAKIVSSESDLTTLESSLRSMEEELSVLRITEAGLKERAGSIHRELEAGLNLIRDRERRLSDVERQLERARAENEEHSGGDGEYIQKIEELTHALAEKRESFAGMRDRLESVSAKVNGAMDRIKALHSSGEEKTQAATQHSLDIERMTAELSHLLQNLEEKYGPGCLDAPAVSPIQEEMNDPVVTLEMSAEEEKILAEDVERLREKIRRLGDVNPTAVEEYDEKKKRFDYLMSEKNDLLKSMDDLNEAIEHINKTSVERFQKAFEAIADRFERLFPIIFGGGQAKLSLVYPEGTTDILEAGVDILAQPPGKKIVNIGLLSGGEKALTAVSLIFAIFMVKPSPFCILDEVDAPLDDANIGKFNALLREMSSKSQFIIITHNKKTMELNDTLYGVTMEEPGVSKMVSIELH